MDIVSAGSGNLTIEEITNQDYSYIPFDLGITFIILSTLFYTLRLLARYMKRVPFATDDWLMVPGYAVQIAYNVATILSAEYGSGRHYLRIIAENSWHFTYWGMFDVYVNAYLYVFAVTLPKLSVLLLYLRVFVQKPSRWCCWTIMGVLVLNLIVEVITISLQCTQFDYGWLSYFHPGQCNNIEAHYTWASVPNLLTDVAIIILPLPSVWKLQIERPAKVGLLLTLLLGSLGLITGILRLTVFIQYNSDYDAPWYAGILEVWAAIETNVYFISACLVTYRPLLQWLWAKLGLSGMMTRMGSGSTKGSRSRSQGGGSRSYPTGSDIEKGLQNGSSQEAMLAQPAPLARKYASVPKSNLPSYTATVSGGGVPAGSSSKTLVGTTVAGAAVLQGNPSSSGLRGRSELLDNSNSSWFRSSPEPEPKWI